MNVGNAFVLYIYMNVYINKKVDIKCCAHDALLE